MGATALTETLLCSGWPTRSTGPRTRTSDPPVCRSMDLETMTNGCPLSQVGEQHHLVVPPAMCSWRSMFRLFPTPSATQPTEESRTTCFALQTPVEMEAVMPVRETQAGPSSLVARTATVEPLQDRTMSSSVSSPLELAALRPTSPECTLGQLLPWTGSTQTPCLSKPAAEESRAAKTPDLTSWALSLVEN